MRDERKKQIAWKIIFEEILTCSNAKNNIYSIPTYVPHYWCEINKYKTDPHSDVINIPHGRYICAINHTCMKTPDRFTEDQHPYLRAR